MVSSPAASRLANRRSATALARTLRIDSVGVRTRVLPDPTATERSPLDTASETFAFEGTRRKSGSHSQSAAVDHQKAASMPLTAPSLPYPFAHWPATLSMNASHLCGSLPAKVTSARTCARTSRTQIYEGPAGGEELEELRRRGAAIVEDGVADADHVAPTVHASGLDVDLRRDVSRFPRLVEGIRRAVVDKGDHSGFDVRQEGSK